MASDIKYRTSTTLVPINDDTSTPITKKEVAAIESFLKTCNSSKVILIELLLNRNINKYEPKRLKNITKNVWLISNFTFIDYTSPI